MAHLIQFNSRQLLSLLAISFWVGVAHSGDPQRVADFRDWTVLSSGSGNEKYCYAITWPKSSSTTTSDRKPYLLVAHQPGQAVRNQVELSAGITFLPNSSAEVAIGRKSYRLYTVGDGAWMESSVQDNHMVSDMRRGSKLTVKGKTGSGQVITDSYSLLGFTAAMKRVGRICP